MNLIPSTNRSNRLTTRNSVDHPLDWFRGEMDRLMGDFFAGWPTPDLERLGYGFDLSATDNEVVVRADVPGFEPDELTVEVQDDVLTLRAETKQEGDGQRSYRRYHQHVTLPAGIDAEQAQATYRNGVLELHLPKRPEVQPKRIAVRSAPDATPQLTADAAANDAAVQPATEASSA